MAIRDTCDVREIVGTNIDPYFPPVMEDTTTFMILVKWNYKDTHQLDLVEPIDSGRMIR